MQANGEPIKMGYELFEEFGHAIDLLLDLGDELPALESTIVDFSEGEAQIVRVGVGDPKIFGGA
jgi:tRNA A37 threonylcarbamoyladenosine synthetase subunit TsaC/SUA5/YrdC